MEALWFWKPAPSRPCRFESCHSDQVLPCRRFNSASVPGNRGSRGDDQLGKSFLLGCRIKVVHLTVNQGGEGSSPSGPANLEMPLFRQPFRPFGAVRTVRQRRDVVATESQTDRES